MRCGELRKKEAAGEQPPAVLLLSRLQGFLSSQPKGTSRGLLSPSISDSLLPLCPITGFFIHGGIWRWGIWKEMRFR